MKKTLRKKFIVFAMAAVTILLVVLIGAINGLSWILLDQQSDEVLHAIANGEEKLVQMDRHDRGPFMPPMSIDTVKSTRFFVVRTDLTGAVEDVDLTQISSVTAEQAKVYAARVTGETGSIETYKYEVKPLGGHRLIFFIDTSSQLQTFVMVLSLSCAIALLCWLVVLGFVIVLSGRMVRPILAGMEKQKQFITNAGHELKTPLAIIQANNDAATLLQGENKYSRNIRLQVQRLSVLMTNLLTLSKLDEEARLPTEPVDVSALLRQMCSEYELLAVEKSQTIFSDISPQIFLQVHRDSFTQMLSILLDNAVKYTPEGGTIVLLLRMVNGHVELTEQNPCNISDVPDPERLFERFYRGDSARTQSGTTGYGIGLSAARAIVENFGGTLHASCTPNSRICFTARFPARLQKP